MGERRGDAQEKDGNTPLHLAIESLADDPKYLEKLKTIGKELLFSGASRQIKNYQNQTPADLLEINASRTNSVDDVRDKIVNFVQMIPFGEFKVVLLDEADYLSPNAQAALRGVMEEYHTTARFILTCNYISLCFISK